MDASDENTTVDDSGDDPTYELPTDFIPEPVPQMQLGNSSEYEPASPTLSNTSSRVLNREKRKRGKRATIEKAQQSLFNQRIRNTIVPSPTPTPDDNDADDDELNLSTRKRAYRRKKPSVLWNHVKKDGNKLSCHHCDKTYTHSQGGATLTPLKHIIIAHYDLLTVYERSQMSQNGESSGNNGTLPKRSLNKQIKAKCPLPRNCALVKNADRALAKGMISTNASFTLLDNVEFGLFAETLHPAYRLPSRNYLLSNVIHPMFEETKAEVKVQISKVRNIGLCTDAWTSMSQISYITVTAHVIDDEMHLSSYVLDTHEIKVRHTSENLIEHIQKVLHNYGISGEQSQNVTLNYNATNSHDIHEIYREPTDQVDFLNAIEEFVEQDSVDSDMTQVINDTATIPENVLAPFNICFTSDNASDISKALREYGNFMWFGCAGHHLNLVAQAGFKNVEAAASLVRMCKKCIEYIKSSIPASYMLKDYQQLLDMPLHKLLQENNTRWWSILLMLMSLVDNKAALTLTLYKQGKDNLIIGENDWKNIRKLIKLFEPFKKAGEMLGSENNVSISLILPVFSILKDLLAEKGSDCDMIKNMKVHMLNKMKTRYSTKQEQFLKACTLLDVRYKSETYVTDGWDYLKTEVRKICESEYSQHQFPATEGQELPNINALFQNNSSNAPDVFDFKDDPMDATQNLQPEALDIEIMKYKDIKMTKEEKKKLNVLDWWKCHATIYPRLFTAAKSMLHIPATSVPAERIFSLAGHVVRLRRSKLLATNVNKFVFLHKNLDVIPPETTITSQTCAEN